MLLRMFTRWAERKGFTSRSTRSTRAPRPGSAPRRSPSSGRYAYGLLTGEKGVHRLIRISPFDANARRQTAFAAFDAVPALDAAEVPDIDPSDLRIDTYRSSGAGGQHVNVTDSAVRITHLPDRRRRVVPEPAVAAAEPGQGDADPRGPPRASCTARSSGPSSSSCRARSATSRSAARSAPTPCTPTSW